MDHAWEAWRRHRRAARWTLAFVLVTASASVALRAVPDGSVASDPEQRPFIVAFELAIDAREEFVWPHPRFPRAGYARVLLVVDAMPWTRERGSTGPFEKLSAAKHLRINGQLRQPRQAQSRDASAAAPEEFAVALEDGRLRAALVVPAGREVDASRRRARITLYEFESQNGPRVPLSSVGQGAVKE
jgi:hypothetical protein